MRSHPFMTQLTARFEAVIIVVLQCFMMLVIAVAIYELFKLLGHGIMVHLVGDGGEPRIIANIGDLQRVLQRAFGGVLLVLLGLELLDTLKSYFDEHRLRLEIIMVVAIIAVGRHIILLDFEHLEAWTLGGIGVLVIALSGSYFLIRRVSRNDAAVTGS